MALMRGSGIEMGWFLLKMRPLVLDLMLESGLMLEQVQGKTLAVLLNPVQELEFKIHKQQVRH